jgi:SAM-dependent methyltransferase
MRRVKAGETFLEIGPGNLNLAQELLSKIARGTLIDFNTTDVQRVYNQLKEPSKQRLTLIIADFSQYDQFPQKFDCVVACEVLEHVEDDRAFLRKANQLLANGGQLILSVPARKKYWSVDDQIAGHYRRYERKELYDKLIEAGFSRIEIASYGFPFQNLVRLVRIALARIQYRERAKWDQKKQTQQSAFMVKRNPYLNLVGLVLNKYTIYPFNLLASLFNPLDLAEGYVLSATKGVA